MTMPRSQRVDLEEDGCRGAFWEGRYRSVALLDEAALLASCAYVDLNPLAAGLAQVPEQSDYRSIKARVEACRRDGTMPALRAALAQAYVFSVPLARAVRGARTVARSASERTRWQGLPVLFPR